MHSVNLTTKPAVLFVIGASGVGKTTGVRALEHRALPRVRCYYFDTIGVPSPEVMERDWGSGEQWQDHATKHWIEHFAANADGAAFAVLDGQTRPSFIQAHLRRAGLRSAHILLLDCAPTVRAARLGGPRAQPELAGSRMDNWGAYLRGQADALGLPVLDTSNLSPDAVADAIQRELEAMRRAAGAPA